MNVLVVCMTSLRLLILSCALISVADATAIVIDHQFDLRQADVSGNTSTGYDGYAISGVFPLSQSVLVSTGDSLELTMRFLQGQTLQLVTVTDRSWIFPWLYPDFDLSPSGQSNFTIANITLDLLDSHGQIVASFSKITESDGNAHLGPNFYGTVPPNSDLTFSALRTSFDVLALETNQYFYVGPWLSVGARDGGGVRIGTLVPEPGTLALLGLGLAGLGLSRRRSAKSIAQGAQ